MRFVGAVCLFLLGSLAASWASKQDYRLNHLNDILDANNPDGGFEEEGLNPAKDPFFQTWSMVQYLAYIGQLDGEEFMNHYASLGFPLNNEGIGYAQANEQPTIIDQSTPGSESTGSSPFNEVSSSGSRSGSLPPLANQFSIQVPINLHNTNVKQPQVPKSSRVYRGKDSLHTFLTLPAQVYEPAMKTTPLASAKLPPTPLKQSYPGLGLNANSPTTRALLLNHPLVDREQLKIAVLHFIVNVVGLAVLIAVWLNYVLLQPYFSALFWAAALSVPMHALKKHIVAYLREELAATDASIGPWLVTKQLHFILTTLLGQTVYELLVAVAHEYMELIRGLAESAGLPPTVSDEEAAKKPVNARCQCRPPPTDKASPTAWAKSGPTKRKENPVVQEENLPRFNAAHANGPSPIAQSFGGSPTPQPHPDSTDIEESELDAGSEDGYFSSMSPTQQGDFQLDSATPASQPPPFQFKGGPTTASLMEETPSRKIQDTITERPTPSIDELLTTPSIPPSRPAIVGKIEFAVGATPTASTTLGSSHLPGTLSRSTRGPPRHLHSNSLVANNNSPRLSSSTPSAPLANTATTFRHQTPLMNRSKLSGTPGQNLATHSPHPFATPHTPMRNSSYLADSHSKGLYSVKRRFLDRISPIIFRTPNIPPFTFGDQFRSTGSPFPRGPQRLFPKAGTAGATHTAPSNSNFTASTPISDTWPQDIHDGSWGESWWWISLVFRLCIFTIAYDILSRSLVTLTQLQMVFMGLCLVLVMHSTYHFIGYMLRSHIAHMQTRLSQAGSWSLRGCLRVVRRQRAIPGLAPSSVCLTCQSSPEKSPVLPPEPPSTSAMSDDESAFFSDDSCRSARRIKAYRRPRAMTGVMSSPSPFPSPLLSDTTDIPDTQTPVLQQNPENPEIPESAVLNDPTEPQTSEPTSRSLFASLGSALIRLGALVLGIPYSLLCQCSLAVGLVGHSIYLFTKYCNRYVKSTVIANLNEIVTTFLICGMTTATVVIMGYLLYKTAEETAQFLDDSYNFMTEISALEARVNSGGNSLAVGGGFGGADSVASTHPWLSGNNNFTGVSETLSRHLITLSIAVQGELSTWVNTKLVEYYPDSNLTAATLYERFRQQYLAFKGETFDNTIILNAGRAPWASSPLSSTDPLVPVTDAEQSKPYRDYSQNGDTTANPTGASTTAAPPSCAICTPHSDAPFGTPTAAISECAKLLCPPPPDPLHHLGQFKLTLLRSDWTYWLYPVHYWRATQELGHYLATQVSERYRALHLGIEAARAATLAQLAALGNEALRALSLSLLTLLHIFTVGFDVLFQLLLFFFTLYSLVVQEQSVLHSLGRVLVFVDREQQIRRALERSIGGILLCSLQMGLFHIGWTWVTFRYWGIDTLRYTCALVSGVIAVVPMVSPWCIAVPPTLWLLAQGQLLNAITLLGAHVAIGWFVDPVFYAAIPDTNPFFAALSILLGLWAFGPHGLLLGPLAMTCLPAAYNLLGHVILAQT
ncbi:hypothetical protein BJ085DRAFT_35618 [Dimargaris cristalligena]|uniref:Transmembrane protein n=1 Tax=Dimargaris cristalligena TaxID=215637 RepID=A0A4P9ZR05_9FUNG|nr:hypothetical protein BJ085DRAFT_35618 [Dimargaris cristalligena]|eukprot:RKP35936.1 hypothetical protein BJ085DRAFT_35618 [Dimargaris cristalligena]